MSAALDQILEQLVAGNVSDPAKVKGCTESQIKALEAEFGVELPLAYREFLARMGSSTGGFFSGTDFQYADLPPLRGYAEALLSEDESPLALDPAHFVFAMHQGYSFLFFRCGVSDDPPVYRYDENEPKKFDRVADRFSSWLASAAKDEIEIEAELRR